MNAPRVEIYRARRGMLRRTQWRARVVAANGETLFVSAESYNNVDYLSELCDRLFPDLKCQVLAPPVRS
jgi:uncharacterized protein YegP (UPF0339 family)